jgi:hypothetical protein
VTKSVFSKIYHRLMTEYPDVWKSDAQLALLVRLLVAADKFYPDRPTANRRNGAYRLLVEAGLVLEKEGTTGYTIRGLEAEHERISNAGRIAAASRWNMPSREEKEKRRVEVGDGIVDNGDQPQSFIRYPKREGASRAPGEALVPIHDGRHGKSCLVCNPVIEEKPRL